MTKKEAQLNALRGEQGPEPTGSQIRDLEAGQGEWGGAGRHWGPLPTVPPGTPTMGPAPGPLELRRALKENTAAYLRGEISSGEATRRAGQIQGKLQGLPWSAKDPAGKLAEVSDLLYGFIEPGPGDVQAANVFALVPSRVSKKALGEITEKWLQTGEKAAEMGEKEVLSKVIENLTSLGKTAGERETLRKAAAEWLRGARQTVFRKGTELGEAARTALFERGPTGRVGLRVAPEEAGTSTYAPYAQGPGGVVNLTQEALEGPFGRTRSLGHEMGEALQYELRRGGADPGLLRALEEAAYLQPFRAPESEQALSLIARRAGTGRQEALQLAKEEPKFVAREVMTGRPHGATAEDMARERVADLLADLSTATGQSRLSDAQLRALRGKVGLLFPQP